MADKYFCLCCGSALVYGYIDWLGMSCWYCPEGDYYDTIGEYPAPTV